jgi:Skp family chaperone for outer membrane proteins
MRLFQSTLLGAVALAGAVAFAQPAAAQAAGGGQVVVIDFARVYQESLAGKDAAVKVKAISDQVSAQLDPEAKSLQAEQAALGPKFQGKTQDQIVADLKNDKALATKYDAFIKRADTFMQLRNLRAQELQATSEKAVTDILNAAAADVQAAMTAKNASVVMERRDIVTFAPAVDISGDVITRLNTHLKTATVTKVDLSKQQQ